MIVNLLKTNACNVPVVRNTHIFMFRELEIKQSNWRNPFALSLMSARAAISNLYSLFHRSGKYQCENNKQKFHVRDSIVCHSQLRLSCFEQLCGHCTKCTRIAQQTSNDCCYASVRQFQSYWRRRSICAQTIG